MLTTISPANPLFDRPVPVSRGVAAVRLSKVERASDDQYDKDALTFEKWVLEVRKTDFSKDGYADYATRPKSRSMRKCSDPKAIASNRLCRTALNRRGGLTPPAKQSYVRVFK